MSWHPQITKGANNWGGGKWHLRNMTYISVSMYSQHEWELFGDTAGRSVFTTFQVYYKII